MVRQISSRPTAPRVVVPLGCVRHEPPRSVGEPPGPWPLGRDLAHEAMGRLIEIVARPRPKREAAGARDHAHSARQRPAQSGAAAAALSPVARYNEPGCGAGEAVLA